MEKKEVLKWRTKFKVGFQDHTGIFKRWRNIVVLISHCLASAATDFCNIFYWRYRTGYFVLLRLNCQTLKKAPFFIIKGISQSLLSMHSRWNWPPSLHSYALHSFCLIINGWRRFMARENRKSDVYIIEYGCILKTTSKLISKWVQCDW